ncbi:MAG: OmpA family protein [Methylocystis sp.]|uniref:OmpA family protein n=1 Tax=Methylocystis sp. TaxID=1911079 RepID=UPI003DA3BD31
MLDFLSFLWPWLAACLALGAATGAFARGGAPRRRPARWLMWFAAAFVAAAIALSFGAVEGAVAAAMESALACFTAFLAGAAAVAAMRGTLPTHERWALGLPAAALLWLGAVAIAGPAYDAQVQKRIAALAGAAGADPAAVAVAGRDVTVPPAMGDARELIAQIAAAPGVRRVSVARAAASGPTEKPTDEAPAPSPTPAPAEAPAPSGGLDAAACQRALDAVAVAEPVAFPRAREIIDRRAAAALDKAVDVIRRCPEARAIEVRGHAGQGAANEALAQRRARAVERYLRREGVAGRKLTAVGCCAGAQEARRGDSAIDYILR